MKKYNLYKNNILAAIFISVLSIFNVQIAYSGSVGEYAKIRSSAEVESLVKTNQLPVEYKYYYTGRDNLPYAIIGIDPRYTLKSRFWHEIESLEQVINKIKHLKRVVRAVDVTYAIILDAEDNQAGLWFSEYFWGIVRFEADNGLTVFSQHGNES